MLFRRRRILNVTIFSLVILANAWVGFADEISLIPEGGFSTGANINALAGPLFGSDLDSVDIAGSGVASAFAELSGNSSEHFSAVELDFSGGSLGFFDSVFGASGTPALTRTSMLDDRATAESIFHFTTDVPTFYEATGFLAVEDALGTTVAGNVELELELLEFDGTYASTPTAVFYNYQVSKSTIDQAFVAGGMDGDFANVLEGSSFGMLDPTKLYRYRTLVTINAIDIDGAGPELPTDGAATAFGAHTLVFGSVPEPSAVSLLSLAGLLLLRRKKA